MKALELDFHTHLAPGVDDGSRCDVETLAMARGLVALGVTRIHLTPHQFRCGNHFAAETVESHAAHVRGLLDGAELPLDVVASAEYCLNPAFLHALERDELFGFEHDGQSCLLAEFPPGQPFVGATTVAKLLIERGLLPILAHPERYGLDVEGLERLRDAGWRLQLNLPSLVDRYGRTTGRTAREMLARGWVDFVGSDLHRPGDLDVLRRAHEAYGNLVCDEVVA